MSAIREHYNAIELMNAMLDEAEQQWKMHKQHHDMYWYEHAIGARAAAEAFEKFIYYQLFPEGSYEYLQGKIDLREELGKWEKRKVTRRQYA